MEQELAYSFHLGSDKNKSKVAKKTAKENISGTTSLSNNAIQNANDLSRVNKFSPTGKKFIKLPHTKFILLMQI